jgi:hypothetical protein
MSNQGRARRATVPRNADELSAACGELLRTPLIDSLGREVYICDPVERAKLVEQQELARIRGQRDLLRAQLAELDRQEERVQHMRGLVKCFAGTSMLEQADRRRS